MALPDQAFTGETIRHTDGRDYAVIDPSHLDFHGPDAVWGKKVAPTLVRVAKPGETIINRPGQADEMAPYIALGGEIVLTNILAHGQSDSYIVRHNDGTPAGMDELERRYAYIGGDIHGEGAFYHPTMKAVPLLHQAVDRPICLRDQYGQGRHAFYDEGDTLKLENGKVHGIDQSAFIQTWKLTDPLGRALDAAKREQGR